MFSLDEQTIPITCANCGNKINKTIGWIKSNNNISCKCGIIINLKTDKFIRDIENVEKSFSDLPRKSV
jgi:DNA-directed RNA polymerase subunit N (RpoN/RPB10)